MRLSKQRLVVTVRQSEFSHAVVEDGICRSDVYGYYSCGTVGLASSRAKKSLADHLNSEYMTQICNFYPLPYPCSYPRPFHHFSILSLCQRHGGHDPSALHSPNFCPPPGDLFLLGLDPDGLSPSWRESLGISRITLNWRTSGASIPIPGSRAKSWRTRKRQRENICRRLKRFNDTSFSIINSTRLSNRIIELLSAVFGCIEYSLSSRCMHRISN